MGRTSTFRKKKETNRLEENDIEKKVKKIVKRVNKMDNNKTEKREKNVGRENNKK